MSSSSKDRYYASNVGKSRRSSPGDAQASVFFQTGQGGRTVLPPLSSAFPTSRFPVPATYSNQYTQPRSSPGRYDLNPQALYNQWPPSSTSPQLTNSFPNYETHERYSTQPSYTAYPSRLSPPILSNPSDSRRLPPLATSSNVGGERWSQSYQVPPGANYQGHNIRSPMASYPSAYVTYSTTGQGNAYSYHMPTQDHVSSLNSQNHAVIFEEMEASRGEHRSSSPYNRGSSQMAPSNYTPPPVSPTTGPEEPTIKKKRKRADAAQLKVLNETYNRTAFPSTEERLALAKALDMSARSVQIWFQNKRQSMRQTNRQSSTVVSASHQPFSMSNQSDPLMDDLHAHSGYNTGSLPMAEPSYIQGHSQEQARSHTPHSSSSHRRPRSQEEVVDPRKWSGRQF